ncbi:MAG: regulatory protein RecX [Brevinematia bacterium]
MNGEVIKKVLKYISFKPRTEREVIDYLKQKLILDDKDISEVIKYLKDSGFIDDDYYKSVYISSKVERGFGPKYIRHKLKGKGIYINDSEVNVNFERIVEIIIRRYGKRLIENKSKATNSVVNFLAYRGFSKSESIKILNQVYEKLGI